MDKLLKELTVSMKPCEQAERIQKAHQVRNQEWVKSRRDEIANDGGGKRRRFNRRGHDDHGVNYSSPNVDSLKEVATSSQRSVSSDSELTDKQSTS